MAREYEIAGASGTCSACGREFAGGEAYVAALFQEGAGFLRRDYCPDCWEAQRAQAHGAFSTWRGRTPHPSQPAKRFVDDEVLVDFFERLGEDDEPARVNFRFVLALMLMRKRLLTYDGSETDQAGREIWNMTLRRQRKRVKVVHPPLDEAGIAEVSAQLGAIFEEPT